MGTVTELLVGLAVVVALAAQFEHHRGNYTKIKQKLEAPAPVNREVLPGGQEPVVLRRLVVPGSLNPEFVSVTLLPGRGMDVLRILANLPGRGEVELLAGSSLEEAGRAMTGAGEDAAGEANLTHGGPILSPWAGRLGGTLAADGESLVAGWQGKSFRLPVNRAETVAPAAFGGLLGKAVSTDTQTAPMPDGGAATAVFLTPGEGEWPAALETKISVVMSSRVLDLTVKVKNTGGVAAPVGVGWAPRFVIPSGNRAKATLRLPAAERCLIANHETGMPSGEMETVSDTAYGFNARNGLALGQLSLDDTFVHLRAKFDQSPTVELRDPGSQMGLRMQALSPTIRAIHVFSPAKASFVSISPQMNYDDPFGREWGKEDTGMKTLAPGETVEWKVRLELFSLMSSATPAF